MKKVFALAGALLLSVPAVADVGDIIVSLKDNQSTRSLQMSGLNMKTSLVEDLNIYLVEPQYRVLDTQKLLETLRSQPEVKWAQEDHIVTLRETVPNDTDFAEQWSLKSKPEADVAATFAWDIGKGGKSIDGQDVVMVVVDQGIEVSHPSLKENIWVNLGEIAGNGIDDDANGYIDDINGWDSVTNTGTVPGETHATHVAGIMGARGNDGSQVTGINWDAKIMTVRALAYGGGNLTSRVLRSYGYVLKQKKLWLETAGAEGANIVVTNSSFGVDRGDCTSGEYPAWDDIYNEMGAVGILSAAATANAGWDIDTTGDVPTGCASDFIISVTNTTAEGIRNSGAGYGLKTIDIGAPGTSILSTYTNGSTRLLTGTSMATPHVAGAIGFLHSVASQDFQTLKTQDPAAAALVIKQALMDTGTPQADLQGKTVSGVRLNLQRSAEALSQFAL